MVDRHMDGLGNEDMATPEIKLIQNTGGDLAKDYGATPGDFFIDLTNEVMSGKDGIQLVIADIIKTRTFWGRDELGDEPPQCASTDALSMRSVYGDDCSTCEHRCDTPGLIDDKQRRMKCLPGYSVLAIRANKTQMPVVIRAHGISAGAVRKLNTQLKLNRQIKGAYEKVIVLLTSEKQKTSSGEAYGLKFELKSLLPDDKAKEFLAITESLLGSEQSMLPAPESEEEEIPTEALEEPEPAKPEPAAKPPAKKVGRPDPENVDLPVADLEF